MQTSRLILSALSVLCCSNLFAEDLKPLDPIKEPDRITWWQLEEKFGSIPKESANWKIGVIEKTMVNEHWRQMQQGYMKPIEGGPNCRQAPHAFKSEGGAGCRGRDDSSGTPTNP